MDNPVIGAALCGHYAKLLMVARQMVDRFEDPMGFTYCGEGMQFGIVVPEVDLGRASKGTKAIQLGFTLEEIIKDDAHDSEYGKAIASEGRDLLLQCLQSSSSMMEMGLRQILIELTERFHGVDAAKAVRDECVARNEERRKMQEAGDEIRRNEQTPAQKAAEKVEREEQEKDRKKRQAQRDYMNLRTVAKRLGTLDMTFSEVIALAEEAARPEKPADVEEDAQ